MSDLYKSLLLPKGSKYIRVTNGAPSHPLPAETMSPYTSVCTRFNTYCGICQHSPVLPGTTNWGGGGVRTLGFGTTLKTCETTFEEMRSLHSVKQPLYN